MNDTMQNFNGIFIGSIVIFVIMFIAALVVMILMFRKMNTVFQKGQHITNLVEERFRSAKQNNSAPRLTVEAKVLSKRQQLSAGYTHYFVAFEKDGGERFELQVAADLVGLICEGDYGTVTVQGTECVQFDRR